MFACPQTTQMPLTVMTLLSLTLSEGKLLQRYSSQTGERYAVSSSLFSVSLSCSYDFTPLDSSAVYVLSSMARQRRTSLSSGGAISPDCDKLERSCSPQSSTSKPNRGHASGTASGATPTKCKRPMNAFMLFAKKYRVEYTQMYPGKDNRYAASHHSQQTG